MATIEQAPNGPLILKGDCEVTDSSGKKLPYEGTAYLCRCGASKNKPYCDGAHKAVGFVDKKESDGSKNKKRDYKGKDITVHYNKELCSHFANCAGHLGKVFDPKAKPWIQPDQATVAEVIETVTRCPSGALSYTAGGKEEKDWNWKDPKVQIAKDGPYYVQGNIPTAGCQMAEGTSQEHYALCRCGMSRNKPFCDGVHHEQGFKAE